MRTAIVVTVHGAAEMTRRFVAYHLNLGIDHIYLFYDDPHPDWVLHFADPRVSVFHRPREFYLQRGLSKEEAVLLRHRTAFNAREALMLARKSGIEWLFRIDVDELIYPNGMSVESLFDEVPSEYQAVQFLPNEAIPSELEYDHPFGEIHWFRDRNILMRKRPQWCSSLMRMLGCRSALYDGEYFRGHIEGKCAVRTEAEIYRLSCHFAMRGPLDPIETFPHPRARVLHFDAVSFSQWVEKWDRRMSNQTVSDKMRPNRRQQVQQFLDARGDEQQIQTLFRDMYMMSPAVFFRLKLLGFARSLNIAPEMFELPNLLSERSGNEAVYTPLSDSTRSTTT